jgi:hypothetical protein
VGISSSTDAPRHRSFAQIEPNRLIRQSPGLLVYGHLRPARLRLRLSCQDRRLRRLAEAQVPGRRDMSSTPQAREENQ